MRVTRILAVASAAAIAFGALVTSSPAQAEPASWPVADVNIVAEGSDTIQFVGDAFQTAYDKTSPANPFISADATGGAIAQTKADSVNTTCTAGRQNGSSAGINALAAWSGTHNLVSGKSYGYACIDIARASRNLKTGDPNWLTSFIFARDLITWSSNTGGDAVSNLSDQELQAIYLCDATKLPTGDTTHAGAVKWSDLKNDGGTSGDEITAVLPQSGSGTRSQWLTDIFGSSVPTSFGSCVANGTFGTGNTPIEENEGTNAVFTAAGNPQHTLTDGNTTGYKDIVFPFSGGDWICEKDTTNCAAQSVGSLALENIDGKAPLTTSTPPTLNIGLGKFPATYVRGLYFVVRNGGSQSAPVVATPNTTGSQWPVDMTPFLNWVCSTAAGAGQSIVTSYGFLDASNCGALLNSTPTPSPAPPTP